MILYLLSWFSSLLVGCFATVCLATGLFYLAELVEEYTVLAKQSLFTTACVTVGINVVVGLFTSIPWSVTAVALLAHAIDCSLLQNFPRLDMDAKFGACCLFTLLHNYVTFDHFARERYPFEEVTAYFIVCVWLMPFGLFISLSVNDNVLPDSMSHPACMHGQKDKRSRAGVLVLLDWLGSVFTGDGDRSKKGY